jgi:hypothetical protein
MAARFKIAMTLGSWILCLFRTDVCPRLSVL